MSPDFLTPIYYFKPYPGSALVIEAVARGFRLPETLEAWAQFDYVAGEPGSVGVGREVRAHRALQVLPRAGVEKGVARQAAAAADSHAIAATGTITDGRSRCCSPAGWCRLQKLVMIADRSHLAGGAAAAARAAPGQGDGLGLPARGKGSLR